MLPVLYKELKGDWKEVQTHKTCKWGAMVVSKGMSERNRGVG